MCFPTHQCGSSCRSGSLAPHFHSNHVLVNMNNMRTLLLVHVWINAGVFAVVNVNEIAYPSEQTPCQEFPAHV
jgi:hypothetical protein